MQTEKPESWEDHVTTTLVECEHPYGEPAWQIPLDGFFEAKRAEDIVIKFFRNCGFSQEDLDTMRDYMTVTYLLLINLDEDEHDCIHVEGREKP